MDLPLLENDLGSAAMIEPAAVVRARDVPPAAVLCFFAEVVAGLAERADARRVAVLRWEHGAHAVHEVEHRGRRLAVLQPGVGAPLAAGLLEEAIALGCRTFVAVGGAGALTPGLALGHPVVVTAAVRDEGTSLHYLPPSRTVEADPGGVRALQQTLAEAGLDHASGPTWTTDAPYRETRARVARRVAEGCLTVEMEASALAAVARYRDVRLAHLLYAADSLAGQEWEHRGWNRAAAVREQLFWLAADAALRWDAAR